MPSDTDKLAPEQADDDQRRDSDRDSPDDGSGASRPLTHAARVERVNAYLKQSASDGVWSAIE